MPEGPDVGDELVRHLGQRHLGDVHLAAGDEGEQQVEGSGEVGQGDGEPGRDPVLDVQVLGPAAGRVPRDVRGGCPGAWGHGAPPRQISSRASVR
ncbi:hypothetical protein ACFFX0_06565 [Citricoccus parietis]|uniref:Uncharacterized protein n=1 Tax=Citricoccus parietis TaxID=592307 RepID=A0ABV5FX83_9MICC